MNISTNKLLLGASSATGVTVATVTPIALTGGSSEVGPENITDIQEPSQPQQIIEPKKLFQKPTWTHKTIPTLTNAGDIQNHHKELPCIKDDLKEITNWSGGNTSSNLTDVKEFPNNSDTKSCLVVEYYKQNYTDGKWWGEFRLAWSIKNEKEEQGFLAVIDVKTKDGKFLGSSAAYILKKQQGAQDKWNVLHAKVNKEEEIKDSSNLENWNPQIGFQFRAKDWNLDMRWGFEYYFNSTCKETYCSETSGNADHRYFVWDFTGGGSGGWLNDWCNDLTSWLNGNFGWGDFLKEAQNIRGTWNKRESSN